MTRGRVGHATAAMTDRYSHISNAAILEAFGKIAERK